MRSLLRGLTRTRHEIVGEVHDLGAGPPPADRVRRAPPDRAGRDDQRRGLGALRYDDTLRPGCRRLAIQPVRLTIDAHPDADGTPRVRA